MPLRVPLSFPSLSARPGRAAHQGRAGRTTGALLVAAGIAAVAAVGTTGTVSADATVVGGAPAGRGGSYAYSFLSSPDFLNNDVADVRGAPGYRAGAPNSYNALYARSLDTVLNTFQGEGVRDLLVAGDLVEGHWWVDTAQTGTFGQLDTFAHRKQVVRNAADTYYGAWNGMVRGHGLRPFPALGDHDIGDNPWHRFKTVFRQKHATVPTYKKAFGEHFTRTASGRPVYRDHPSGPARDTAYAYRLHREVQLVTVDVFERTRTNVAVRLDRQQLAWLERVLRKARADGVDWIIVQGHTPVVGPVRVSDNSSGLMYEGGRRSAFWQLLKKYDVNAYLAGEVHAITSSMDGGVAQVVHGGTFVSGNTSYIRVDVTPQRLRIVARQFQANSINRTQLWGMDERRGGPELLLYRAHPRVVGTMDITRDHRMVNRTGQLTKYRP